MIKDSWPITVAEEIANITSTLIYNGEEIILTQVSSNSYGHKVVKRSSYWQILYLEDSKWHKPYTCRKVLFEKIKRNHNYFYWKYDFYEAVEVIGKGCELKEYEDLFLYFKNHNCDFEPENTLILKRPK